MAPLLLHSTHKTPERIDCSLLILGCRFAQQAGALWGQRIKQLLVANGVAVVRRPAASSRIIANKITP